MTIKGIRIFAKEKGFILPIKATKEVLIHNIQKYEENQACYATKVCDNYNCLWSKDCVKAIKNKKAMNKN